MAYNSYSQQKKKAFLDLKNQGKMISYKFKIDLKFKKQKLNLKPKQIRLKNNLRKSKEIRCLPKNHHCL